MLRIVVRAPRLPIYLLALGLYATGANAESIANLFSSGVDDSGQVLSGNTLEQHYSMTGPDPGALEVLPGVNSAWVIEPVGSKWIGPDDGNILAEDGYYDYTIAFDLTSYDHTTAAISGEWSSDNEGRIYLNDTWTGDSTDRWGYQDLHPFTIANGFVPGINELRFHVFNAGGVPNPTALLVANVQGTVDPLPKSSMQLESCRKCFHHSFSLANLGPDVFNFLYLSEPIYSKVIGPPDSSAFFGGSSIHDPDPVSWPLIMPSMWSRINGDTLSTKFEREAWWFYPSVPAPSPDTNSTPLMSVSICLPVEVCTLVAGGVFEVDFVVGFDGDTVEQGTMSFACTTEGIPTSTPNGQIKVIVDESKSQLQNAPNPFNPVTMIRFDLPQEAEVRLAIYDVTGRLVAALVDEYLEAGELAHLWDGKDESGQAVKSGIYFARLDAGEFTATRKMVLLR